MLRPYKIPVYSLPLHGGSVALLELLPTPAGARVVAPDPGVGVGIITPVPSW